ncbi:MAG: condensation domain-containing protein [Acidobacteriota bacterium]
MSFGQQRLWFLDQLEPQNPAYHVQVALRLRGPLDLAALEASLSEIARRHEILRTTFQVAGGEPRQVIAPAQSLASRVAAVPDGSGEDREREVLRLAHEESLRPFDLARGPLVRVSLFRMSEQDHVFVVVMHHIVTDGWSTSVFFRELGALYRAFRDREPSPLPEPPMQYADFAEWQRRWLLGDVLEEQLTFWKRQLGQNLPMLDLPLDRPRSSHQGQGARQSFRVSRETAEGLKSLGLDEGATLYMSLLAVFAMLLHARTGQEDIVIGTPMAGRTQLETEDLIGFFVNPLVLRIDLSGDPTFRELLGRVREVALDGYAHQDLPFEKLVEVLHAQRTLSSSPLYQVWFAFQNVPDPRPELPGILVTALEPDCRQLDRGPTGTARHDLRFGLSQTPDGLRGDVEYKTDLFDAPTIASLVFDYETLLRIAVEDSGRTLRRCMERLREARRREGAGRRSRHSEAARGSLLTSRRKPLHGDAPDETSK